MNTADLKTGLFTGEAIDAYHAADAWSKSKLDDFRRLPLFAFQKYVEKSIPREPLSDQFRIGLGAHSLVLEGPEAYAAGFAIVPADAPQDLRRFRNAKKPSEDTLRSVEWWDAFDGANRGKIIIPREDDALNHRLRQSVHSHPLATVLLGRGKAEVTARVKASRYHLQCRFDWLVEEGASLELVDLLRKSGVYMDVSEPYACDFKTVASLSELDYHNFSKNFATFGYHRQGPFYRAVAQSAAGLGVDRFFFIATEKQPPFSTVVFLPDDTANEKGWEEVQEDIQRLNECMDTGIWPGMPTSVQVVRLPAWYGKRGDS